MQNPYAWDNKQLVEGLIRALSPEWRRTDIATNTLNEISRTDYLKGILFSRFEGLQPPFQPRDIVQSKRDIVRPSTRNHFERSHHERILPKELTVLAVYYFGDHCWNITFTGKDPLTADEQWICEQDENWKNNLPLLFDANDFVLAQPEAVAVLA